MYNGHLGDSERQKSHCLIPGFGEAFELANPAAILETLVEKEPKESYYIGSRTTF